MYVNYFLIKLKSKKINFKIKKQKNRSLGVI